MCWYYFENVKVAGFVCGEGGGYHDKVFCGTGVGGEA